MHLLPEIVLLLTPQSATLLPNSITFKFHTPLELILYLQNLLLANSYNPNGI